MPVTNLFLLYCPLFNAGRSTFALYQLHTLHLASGEQEHGGTIPRQESQRVLAEHRVGSLDVELDLRSSVQTFSLCLSLCSCSQCSALRGVMISGGSCEGLFIVFRRDRG